MADSKSQINSAQNLITLSVILKNESDTAKSVAKSSSNLLSSQHITIFLDDVFQYSWSVNISERSAACFIYLIAN